MAGAPGVDELQVAYERAELVCDEAAEAEQAAFARWQELLGAYEVARTSPIGRGGPTRPRSLRRPDDAERRPAGGTRTGRPAPSALTRKEHTMNARQRREAASFVAAGGSFETYTLWDRLGPVVRRLFGRPVRQPAPDRWSR